MNTAALLEAVREACPRGLWSQGVKLAREGAVRRESGGAGEIVLRVAAPGTAVAATVVLYPDEGEWECDCGSRFDACAHVAAAVIALGQPGGGAGRGGRHPALSPRARGRAAVRRRAIAPDGAEIDLPASLFSIAAGRVAAHGLVPNQCRPRDRAAASARAARSRSTSTGSPACSRRCRLPAAACASTARRSPPRASRCSRAAW